MMEQFAKYRIVALSFDTLFTITIMVLLNYFYKDFLETYLFVVSHWIREIPHYIQFLIVFFLINTLSEVMMGKTIGKAIVHLKVVTTDFTSITFLRFLLRNVLKALLLPLVALHWLFLPEKETSLHDKIAHTEIIQL